MATVPYQAYATATPAAPDAPQIRENVTSDMFGGNVGQAMERLGTSEDQVGNELYQRALALQQLNNENNARAAQSEYAEQASLLHAKFGSQLGSNANPQALQEYIAAQKDLREKIRGGLQTTDAQIYYDRDTLPFMQRNVFSAAGHAEDQMKEVGMGNALARVKNITENWTGTPGEYDEKVGELKDPIATYGAIKGWTPEQVQAFTHETMSNMSMRQIEEMARTNPQAALAAIDANEQLDPTNPRRMTQDAHDHAIDFARGRNTIVGSESLAKDIYSPNKSIEEMIAEVGKRAPALAHGDPMFGPAVERRLRGLVGENKAFERSDQNDTVNMLTNAVIQNPNITNQELLANPEVQDRVNRLPPALRAKIIGGSWLAGSRAQVTYEDQHNKFNELWGLATSGRPDDAEKFMSTDLTQQGLDHRLVAQLQALRAQAVKNEADPVVHQALGWIKQKMGTDLVTAGVIPGTPQYDKTTEMQYRGAIAIAIDAWRQDHGGNSPDPKYVTDVIAPTVIQQIKPRGLFSWFSSGHPMFAPPQGDVNDWGDKSGTIKDFTTNVGRPPTDDELSRMYLREQFIELYSKVGPNAGSAGK